MAACDPSTEEVSGGIFDTQTAVALSRMDTSLPTTLISVNTLTPFFIPTNVPTMTFTPVAFTSSTPFDQWTALTYTPVPRWMILEQPGYSVEILGESWSYVTDNWNESVACIRYGRGDEGTTWIEQCFALVSETGLSFQEIMEPYIEKGFETLTPRNTFGDIGQIGLVGIIEGEVVRFFELIKAEGNLYTVEMAGSTSVDGDQLQEFYENQAADIIDFALRDSLQRSRVIPGPSPTPLSPKQQTFYDSLSPKLITEQEANALYSGTWELLGDWVYDTRVSMCRDFEDRTNADVLWVRLANCVFYEGTDFNFEDIDELFYGTDVVILESRHEYDDKFTLLGLGGGHTYFHGWLQKGEYLYLVDVDSRTPLGMSVEDLFSEEVDDFIYNVLMTNVRR